MIRTVRLTLNYILFPKYLYRSLMIVILFRFELIKNKKSEVLKS